MPPLIPGWITHSASFIVGAVAATVGIFFLSSESRAAPNTISDKVESSDELQDTVVKNNNGMLPTPLVRIFTPNDDLTIAFDGRTRNPIYVVERLRPLNNAATSSTSTSSRKGMNFREEKSLSPYHRSRNAYYRDSGYDRGHLAPAADYHGKNMVDTFVLTNASPQIPRFNRSIWLRLEEFVRKEALKGVTVAVEDKVDSTKDGEKHEKSKETWVVTGPLWLPRVIVDGNNGNGSSVFRYSYDGIGRPPSLIAVPTHFYKVIVVVDVKTSNNEPGNNNNNKKTSAYSLLQFAAFVLPNSDMIGEKESGDGGGSGGNGIRLVDYIVNLTDLEAVSGLEFFPLLFGTFTENDTDDVTITKSIADALTDEIRESSEKKKMVDKQVRNSSIYTNNSTNSLVAWTNDPSVNNEGGLSKGRRKKIKQMLRDNSPIMFQHICRNNDDCYKFLRV
jgi:DNA/RNA endonuclease G (NUC1)